MQILCLSVAHRLEAIFRLVAALMVKKQNIMLTDVSLLRIYYLRMLRTRVMCVISATLMQTNFVVMLMRRLLLLLIYYCNCKQASTSYTLPELVD